MQNKVIQSWKKQKGSFIDWHSMGPVLSGVSIIDLKKLSVKNKKQALDYALNYGLDVSNPIKEQLVQDIHIEAVQCIEDMFLPTGCVIPPVVSAPRSPLDLLVYASGYDMGRNEDIQAWSCAILKVMHCFFQLEYDLKLKNINSIRKQIYADYESLISMRDEAIFLEDKKESLPLFFFKFKKKKSKQSIILKLLHKPHMAPSDIYDHLGIRFVLNTKIECLLAFDFFSRHSLITEANIKPFRSRNTLVDIEEAKKLFDKYKKRLKKSDEYPAEIYRKMDKKLPVMKLENVKNINPFSASDYRSIQITVRKMIELSDSIPTGMHGASLAPAQDTFYFDYEIQLIDKETWLKTRRGPTSHAAYKRRQVEVARRRVLGPVLLEHLKIG
ncbi:MAG: TIGR04552 family protein [Acidobacteria bacterium]|nr:MAG: TIGR04552 family protein [Acidobacteriota bacterium]